MCDDDSYVQESACISEGILCWILSVVKIIIFEDVTFVHITPNFKAFNTV